MELGKQELFRGELFDKQIIVQMSRLIMAIEIKKH
jgi:hypothetical protein